MTVGCAAAIGFTVALFFATAAFPPGPLLDEAKLGALLSVSGALRDDCGGEGAEGGAVC